MKIIFISEHYFPRIGGVTTYVKNIFENSKSHFDSATLIVPSEEGKGKIKIQKIDRNTEIHIGVGSSLTGNISSKTRKTFIFDTFNYLKSLFLEQKFDAIHVLYGLYTIRFFDFKHFRDLGVKCGVTIHNIPPAECGVSWKGDKLSNFLKDEIRKIGIGIVNKRRIQYQNLDFYIVPSYHVKSLLKSIVDEDKITVIGHGNNTKIIKFNPKETRDFLQILCVGGFVPHKRQDALIDIASSLRDKGYNIKWIFVGPIRNIHYFKYIQDKILDLDIELKVSISQKELDLYYSTSDIYIQPSLEEGFCLTALDAATYGLPIVATPTGALPEIVQRGCGIIADFGSNGIETTILQILNSINHYKATARLKVPDIIDHFNWERSLFILKNTISGS